jgi:hypothetical protein
MPRNAVAFEAKDKADRRKPGAYWFMLEYSFDQKAHTERVIGILHSCPCGCGAKGCIWFKGGSGNGSGSWPDHEWDVTGEWPNVSLTPSIGFGRLAAGGYHWHGYLRKGVFEEC